MSSTRARRLTWILGFMLGCAGDAGNADEHGHEEEGEGEHGAEEAQDEHFGEIVLDEHVTLCDANALAL